MAQLCVLAIAARFSRALTAQFFSHMVSKFCYQSEPAVPAAIHARLNQFHDTNNLVIASG